MSIVSDGVPQSIATFVDHERHLWAAALALFVVGDLVTTAVGVRLSSVVEVGPLVAPLIRRHGVVAMVGLKCLATGLCYGLCRLVPSPHHVGVPLGLTALGGLVTAWNAALIAFRLRIV